MMRWFCLGCGQPVEVTGACAHDPVMLAEVVWGGERPKPQKRARRGRGSDIVLANMTRELVARGLVRESARR